MIYQKYSVFCYALQFFLAFSLNACKGQEPVKILTIQKEKELVLLTKPKQYWCPGITNYFVEDNKPFLLVNNHHNDELLKYDMQTGQIVQSIPLKNKPFYDVLCHDYQSSDSIFVVFNAANHPSYKHDGSIVRMNSKGEILEKYAFEGAPVWAKGNPKYKDEEAGYVFSVSPDFYVYPNLCFNYCTYLSGPGDEIFHQLKMPLGGHINVAENKLYNHTPVTFPGKVGEYRTDDDLHPDLCMRPNGNPVYSLAHSGTTYEYDYKTQKVIPHIMKSLLCDTILPLPIKPRKEIVPRSQRRNTDPETYVYGGMRYDPYRKRYYRFMGLSVGKGASPKALENRPWAVMMFDENLNKVGEGILPKGLSTLCFFAKEGVYFWNKEETQRTGNYVFNLCEMDTMTGNIAALRKQIPQTEIRQIKEGGLAKFVTEKVNTNASRYAVFVIPTDRGCTGCSDELIGYYQKHLAAFTQKNIFLLLVADNSAWIKTKLERASVLQNSPNLLLDGEAEYQNYLEETLMKTQLMIFEAGKCVKQLPIGPDEAIKIEHILKKNYDKM